MGRGVARTFVTGGSALAAAPHALQATAYAQPNLRMQPRHGKAKHFAFDGAATWAVDGAEKQPAADTLVSI